MSELTDEIRAMRVAVAKDVIARIDMDKLRIDTGLYLYTTKEIDADVMRGVQHLRPIVDAVEANCQVCAKGALLLSKVRLYDSVPLDEVLDDDGRAGMGGSFVSSLLADIFDAATLDRIESAFEVNYSFSDKHGMTEAVAAEAFGARYDDPAERCKAVMMNVVANGGEFRPDLEGARP